MGGNKASRGVFGCRYVDSSGKSLGYYAGPFGSYWVSWQEEPSKQELAAIEGMGAQITLTCPDGREEVLADWRGNRWEKRNMSAAPSVNVNGSPWDMEVTVPGTGGDFETPPKGNQIARIVGLFDCGHVPEENDKGNRVQVRKLVVVFELAKKNSKGEPFCLSQEYRWSMATNSNFYGLVKNLIGEKREGEKFDPRELGNRPCLVTVNHTEREKNGKKYTYANLGDVTAIPDGFPEPEPAARTPVAWSVMEGTPIPDTSWVPWFYGKTVRGLIEASAEYQAGNVQRPEAEEDIPY